MPRAHVQAVAVGGSGLRLCDYNLTGNDVLSPRTLSNWKHLYDDEIDYIDRKIGEVLTCLKSNGLDDNTLMVITADHGEHFGEHHQMEHQFSVYEPLGRVPLIVRHHDRFAAGREEGLVQTHDIYPTILEFAGLECKPPPGQTCQSPSRPTSAGRLGISENLEPMPVRLGQHVP